MHVDGVGPPSARQPPDQTTCAFTNHQSVITDHFQLVSDPRYNRSQALLPLPSWMFPD